MWMNLCKKKCHYQAANAEGQGSNSGVNADPSAHPDVNWYRGKPILKLMKAATEILVCT